jgi:tRNA U34 5-methylaminomethyl-2-thiouridine-forming methyltransferase MnmC
MTKRFNCIAFDAFSSKSTPELWTRDFLDHFLASACDDSCVLSTYACTGNLKRALIDAGFELRIREGYASKRDSTLAVRKPK